MNKGKKKKRVEKVLGLFFFYKNVESNARDE